MVTDENRIIAGTGHRPKWMPCGYNENHEWAYKVKNELAAAIKDVPCQAVISGMAIGWDTWLAEAAIRANVPLWAYIPFKGQGNKWPNEAKNRYNRILKQADRIVHTQEHYSKSCFHVRDRRMVDDATTIFALYNPEIKQGGTFYTVDYAQKQVRTIINFWR